MSINLLTKSDGWMLAIPEKDIGGASKISQEYNFNNKDHDRQL
jgi:hypothetical protein